MTDYQINDAIGFIVYALPWNSPDLNFMRKFCGIILPHRDSTFCTPHPL